MTLKLEEYETGIARITAGPRGWKIRVDGKEVGRVAPSGGGGWRPLRGWYFYAGDESLGIPYVNTASDLASTAEEAKEAAKKYVKDCFSPKASA